MKQLLQNWQGGDMYRSQTAMYIDNTQQQGYKQTEQKNTQIYKKYTLVYLYLNPANSMTNNLSHWLFRPGWMLNGPGLKFFGLYILFFQDKPNRGAFNMFKNMFEKSYILMLMCKYKYCTIVHFTMNQCNWLA